MTSNRKTLILPVDTYYPGIKFEVNSYAPIKESQDGSERNKLMINDFIANEQAGAFSKRQQLFFRHTYIVLIDLTVLNLFNQYWDNVYIGSFTVSLLAAILLQVMLQITISIEHRVADYFKKKSGLQAKILRG